ncbi:SCP2 sterol-binding domain-containing protein [Hyphomicrobium sp. CS1BSMeth3]|uniref:ubiquinone anaerobic biosynthesis accessory factor UbiT n=1 Tax=Hyphomicrobium sp. CS1BSMeth3 TaxID=1892844 RepID=UPI0009F87530|nr:SCP2 sterol-binding domain-containing protein [Hyphomicrobium sp. CS1BSMeth3]
MAAGVCGDIMFTLSFRRDFRVPDVVSSALRPLPLLPLEIFLQQLASNIVTRHPDILTRIGRTDLLRFGIDPTDVPFAIEIELRDGVVGVHLRRELDEQSQHARISGTLAALMRLVDGEADGDALFFSREIVVTGDIAAVLALRNAVDAAEIGILREAAALIGLWISEPGRLLRGMLTDEPRRERRAQDERFRQ